MDFKNLLVTFAASAAAVSVSFYSLFSQEDTRMHLTPESRIAIFGDGTAEAKKYSVMLDTYLNACAGFPGIPVFQFGQNGESAESFVKRMEKDTAFWDPDVITVLYGGRHDGLLQLDPRKAETLRIYLDSLDRIADFFRGKKIILASPLPVDPAFHGNKAAKEGERKNRYLESCAKQVFESAVRNKAAYVDMNGIYASFLAESKKKFGEPYKISGGDGLTPSDSGHLILAYAFLKKLRGTDPVADLVIDLSGTGSRGSEGHRIVSEKPGAVEWESTRYPYCFTFPNGPVRANDAGDLRNILEIVPFQDELNMFRLRVVGLTGQGAKVTWGKNSREFTAEQLQNGINLAAEFPDNPFCEAFRNVRKAVVEKQNFETELYRRFGEAQQAADRLNISPEGHRAFDIVIEELRKRHAFFQEKVRSAVRPVRHTILVAPLP